MLAPCCVCTPKGRQMTTNNETVVTDEDIIRMRETTMPWKRLYQVGHRWTYYTDNLDGTLTIMTRGEHILIDKKSLPQVADYAWRVSEQGYAVAPGAYGSAVHMHKLLCPSAPCVDHINRDTLDNRLDNLRPATHSLNANNISLRKDSKSGVNGVYDEYRLKRYIVTWSMVGGKHRRYISYGPRSNRTKEEAFAVACALRRKIDEATGCLNGHPPLQT